MAGATVSPQVANEAYSITTSNTAPNVFSYLYVGGTGDVSFVPEFGGSAVTMTSVPAGSYVWCRTSIVRATGTTATNLVGFK